MRAEPRLQPDWDQASERDVSHEASEITFATEIVQVLVRELHWGESGTSQSAERSAAPDFDGRQELVSAESKSRPAAPTGQSQTQAGEQEGESLDQLSTEIHAEGIGRLQIHVRRSAEGLNIVMGVADSSVKQMIERAQQELQTTLQNGGLRVHSVQVQSSSPAGTTLAQDRSKARTWTVRNKREPYRPKGEDPTHSGARINFKV